MMKRKLEKVCTFVVVAYTSINNPEANARTMGPSPVQYKIIGCYDNFDMAESIAKDNIHDKFYTEAFKKSENSCSIIKKEHLPHNYNAIICENTTKIHFFIHDKNYNQIPHVCSVIEI